MVDPASAAVEHHRKCDRAWLDLAAALDEAQCDASKTYGSRPSLPVFWRDYYIGESEIEGVHDELLKLSGIDPKTIQNEYWAVKARLLGADSAAKQWDERAGLAALRRDHDRAHSAERRAAWTLARTKATTAAGAAVMLEYITFGQCVGLFDLGETDWHETAFRTVVAALAKITRQSPRKAA